MSEASNSAPPAPAPAPASGSSPAMAPPPPDAAEFASMDALARVAAVDRAFGADALLLASMQKTSGILMHMIHRVGGRIRVIFVDTQYHFPETLALRDEFIRRYGISIETVLPDLTPDEQREKYGCELYEFVDGQPTCCNLRKEVPFLKHAAGFRASLSGLMRGEGGKRGELKPVGFDRRLSIPTFHPIFDWSFEDVDAYTKEHDLPVHPLYEKNYLSIGCAPCTTPVLPGEDRRAGRWRHLRTADGNQPIYCNINYSDGGGI